MGINGGGFKYVGFRKFCREGDVAQSGGGGDWLANAVSTGWGDGSSNLDACSCVAQLAAPSFTRKVTKSNFQFFLFSTLLLPPMPNHDT